MRFLILGLFFAILSTHIKAQTKSETIAGKVSYVSSQNIYVKFESTRNILAGDTLYIQKDNGLIPALLVTNLSSTSCICTPISNLNFTLSSTIISKTKVREIPKNKEVKEAKVVKEKILIDSVKTSTSIKKKQNESAQKIAGSISASSYSYFSNTAASTSNRFQYTLSLNARNIADSKLSAETYITFRHDPKQWSLVQDNIFQALKIYTLSLKYDLSKTTQIILGRKINPKMSSVGAIDGIQFEQRFNNFFIGVIAGTRPNYIDYNYDSNLLQYGGYIAHTTKNAMGGTMENSFGIIEQMNKMKTDRRFAYFQHTNSLLKNLYFFGSMEIDLFKNLNDTAQNILDVSSYYLSLNYRAFKKIGFSASYDNRKNVIYYETYKSFINQMIDMEARQGMSFQVNFNSQKSFSAGIRNGYNFQKSVPKPSQNIYGYITLSNISGIRLSATLAATYLETSYINGKVLNLNLTRDFFQGKLYIYAGYQHVNYVFSGMETSLIQHVADLNISLTVIKNLSLSINMEQTFENKNQYSRLNLQLRKRF